MKNIFIITFLFLFNQYKGQSYDKILLVASKDNKFFVNKFQDYNVLFSYSEFMQTFKKGGINSSDTIYKEFMVMKLLLSNYFEKNDRLNPSMYMDRTSTKFLDTLLSKYTNKCIKSGSIVIENSKSRITETYIYHFIEIKEEKYETKTTEGYLISDKKTSLIWTESIWTHM